MTAQERRYPRDGSTTDQLRDDIDRGRTGSKVAAFDPAAAPLGTDDEAAGHPPDPRLVERVRVAETGMVRSGPRRPGWLGAFLAVLVAALLFLVGLLAAYSR